MTARNWLGTGLWFMGVLVGTGAHAAQTLEQKSESHWGVRLEANTDFPLGVGGRVALITPVRLYVSASLDAMISPYAQAVGSLTERVGYSSTKAGYLEHGLQGSLAWRAHLGWQPSATSGFYLEAGYGQLVLGGQVNPEDALVSILHLDPPTGDTTADRQYFVRAVVHQVDLELGWRWKLGGDTSPWSLRAALGGTYTFQSKTQVEARFEPNDAASVNAFTQQSADKADSYFKKYGYVPTIALSVGYTF